MIIGPNIQSPFFIFVSKIFIKIFIFCEIFFYFIKNNKNNKFNMGDNTSTIEDLSNDKKADNNNKDNISKKGTLQMIKKKGKKKLTSKIIN